MAAFQCIAVIQGRGSGDAGGMYPRMAETFSYRSTTLDLVAKPNQIAVTTKNKRPISRTDTLWNSPWLLTVAVIAAPSLVAAQPIDTNRPGFSYSPNVVAPGQWQLETGISYTHTDSDTHTTSLPLAELRVGVADQVELFASSMSWFETTSGNDETSGLVDMAIGTKVNINNAEARTRMALLFQLSVPIGYYTVSSDRWDPGFAFIWSHDANLALAGTVKISRYERGYRLDNGLKLPFSVGEAGSAFVEWEANLPESGDSTHWLNGGYQLLIDDHMQLDFNAGLGLNDSAKGYRLGVGFSIQL